MSLPPEILLRTFGTEVPEIELDGDVDAQLRLVCLCRPIFRGIAPSGAELSTFLKDRIDHHLGLYREFIRPAMIDGLVFHHTPFLPHTALTPCCALEYARPDHTAAVGGVFRTSASGDPEYVFKPRGLHPAFDYKVTLDNAGLSWVEAGRSLARDGIGLRLEQPQTSELVRFQSNIR